MDDKPTKTEPSPPQKKRPEQSAAQQFALAMELPFVLVSAILVGGLFGWLLDRWLHTKPILMLILGALGFYAGVREVLRRLPGNDDGSKER